MHQRERYSTLRSKSPKETKVFTITRYQFHKPFSPAFFVRNPFMAAFSSYILALAKNYYEKCAHLTLMKLTAGKQKWGAFYLLIVNFFAT